MSTMGYRLNSIVFMACKMRDDQRACFQTYMILAYVNRRSCKCFDRFKIQLLGIHSSTSNRIGRITSYPFRTTTVV